MEKWNVGLDNPYCAFVAAYSRHCSLMPVFVSATIKAGSLEVPRITLIERGSRRRGPGQCGGIWLGGLRGRLLKLRQRGFLVGQLLGEQGVILLGFGEVRRLLFVMEVQARRSQYQEEYEEIFHRRNVPHAEKSANKFSQEGFPERVNPGREGSKRRNLKQRLARSAGAYPHHWLTSL